MNLGELKKLSLGVHSPCFYQGTQIWSLRSWVALSLVVLKRDKFCSLSDIVLSDIARWRSISCLAPTYWWQGVMPVSTEYLLNRKLTLFRKYLTFEFRPPDNFRGLFLGWFWWQFLRTILVGNNIGQFLEGSLCFRPCFNSKRYQPNHFNIRSISTWHTRNQVERGPGLDYTIKNTLSMEKLERNC